MYKLVAHRGYPTQYPENSLLSIHQALMCGAQAVEFDIQCSAQGTPFVFHDEDTLRLTGKKHTIYKLQDAQIRTLSAHCPESFDQQYQPTPIATLDEISELLKQFPEVEVFIEPKAHSIERIGMEKVMDAILLASDSLGDRRRIISFHHEALAYARDNGCPVINWVIDNFTPYTQEIAKALNPDMLCIDIQHVTGPLPKWIDAEWMVYPVNQPEKFKQYSTWGASYIETDCIGDAI